MTRMTAPLNALRAFEAAARHLSFTRAAEELCVTQAAISHQVKGQEERLGATLFRRSHRGLVLTDEGLALAPALWDAFGRIDTVLERFEAGGIKEVLTVSAVGTFAVGALLKELPSFRALHPFVDLRLLTNNNKVDLATEGLDYAIRFGDGAWNGTEAEKIATAPLAPLCAPALLDQLSDPADLARVPLLRSYRAQDWPAWFAAAGTSPIAARGPLFDSSLIMAQAAMLGEGVALAPVSMFQRELDSGQLVQPFAATADVGAYWLTRLKSKETTAAMLSFRDWILGSEV
jgi:LysR family transcriptional regulator of beta-lactamase